MKDSEFQTILTPDISSRLLRWYDTCRRILPWREDPAPYHVWISEIMLQQTRVDTVIPYYERFLAELPDVAALAEVSEERLFKLWEGLGYYSRARNLKKAAIQIREEYAGVLPSAPDELVRLAGIGPYTAAAIASIAYGVRVPSVDGNLLRVYARLTLYDKDIRSGAAKKQAEKEFLDILPEERPGDQNQAFMDLGATVCLPNGQPLCGSCPLEDLCLARRHGLETALPIAKEKMERPVLPLTVFLIHDESSVLIRKRPSKGLLAGLTEFPGMDGHLDEAAIRQHCTEEGLPVLSVSVCPKYRHVFSHRTWNVLPALVRIAPADGSAPAFGGRFVPLAGLSESVAFPSAFAPCLALLPGIS